MKFEEKIAENYLHSMDIGDVSFEPDGNIPPDFRVGNSIGVEVRRLNQNFFGVDDTEGLEELSIPRWKLLENVISEFDNRYEGESYWVSARYWRPSLQNGSETATSIRCALENFLIHQDKLPVKLVVSGNLQLTIYTSEPIRGRVFRFAGGTDRDLGGWLIPIYVENIAHCIEEKSLKIFPQKDRYDTWWLLLVDFVDMRIDVSEKSDIKSMITGIGLFDRVIVIDRHHGRLLLEFNHTRK